MNKMFRFVKRSALPVALTGAAAASHAAAVDVTAVVTDIGAQGTSVAAIGAAVLLLSVGIKAFKWVRRAMS
jgi:hypothetical protein